jgi:hypothetical protein
MQKVFHMTADGVLRDPQSGVRHEPAHWPGQVVTVCPLRSTKTQDEFEYLAIVEMDAVPQPVSSAEVLKVRSGTAQPWRLSRRGLACTRSGSPLTVQRSRRLWFCCSSIELRQPQ